MHRHSIGLCVANTTSCMPTWPFLFWLTLTDVVSTVQQDFEPMPAGSNNPHGNGFKAVERDLLTERKAMRVADPFKGRIWKIKNPESLHPVTGALGLSYLISPICFRSCTFRTASHVGRPNQMGNITAFVRAMRHRHGDR